MKVPVYDAPQAQARADVPSSINLVEPNNDALQRGIERGADALGKGIDEARDRYEKFKHEARSADVANGLAAYANDATDKFHGAPSDPSTSVVGGGGSTPGLQATPSAVDAATAGGERTVQLPGIVNPDIDTGFLGTRGKAAAAAEQPLFQSLAQRRDQIAAGFTDPDTKKLFLARVQQYDLELRAKAESHVGQQVEVAKEDAAKNISDAAVRAAAADPGDDKGIAHLFGEARGAVGALGRGEDFDALHDRQLRAEIAGTRIDGLLAPGPHQDIVKARQVLEANRDVLGKALDNYDRALAIAERTDNGQALASAVLERARRPSGFIDEGAAIASWAKLPPERRTKEAIAAFDNGIELAKKQEVAVKSDKFNVALSAYLQRHSLNDVPPTLRAWMAGANGEPGNDSKGWHELERIAHEDRESAKGAGSNDDQRWAFASFDVDIKAHPEKYAQMTPEEFKRTWWGQFAKADRERAAGLFAGAHGEVKPEQLNPAEGRMLLEQGRKAGLFPAGNDVSKWEDDSAQLYYGATKELERRSTEYRQLKREPPPFEKVQEWVGELVQEGKIPGTGYNVPLLGRVFEKKTTKLEAVTKGTEFAPTWSADQRTSAANALKKAGIQDVTDDKVDTFLRRKSGLPAKPAQSRDVLPAPPRNAAELEAAGSDYGLDLSQGPSDAVSPGD